MKLPDMSVTSRHPLNRALNLLCAFALFVAAPIAVASCAATSTSGQSTTTPSVAVDPHQLAIAADNLLWAGWTDAASACKSSALSDPAAAETIREKCVAVLKPARDSLLLADAAIDAWDAAAQRNFPCLVSTVTLALSNFENLSNIAVPQSVKSAILLAQSYAGKCQ